MKLTSVEVNDFRSIRRSNKFKINDVTCLVGKNESGKTALLQALYKLNPIVVEEGKFDVTDDYPRIDVEDYRQQVESGEDKPAIVVSAEYELDSSEINAIEEQFGKSVLKSKTFSLSKGYENIWRVGLTVNEAVAVSALVNQSELPAPDKNEASDLKTLSLLTSFLDEKQRSYAKAAKDATEKAQSMPEGEAKQEAIADSAKMGSPASIPTLKKTVDEILARGLSLYIWDHHVKQRVPKFLYFDEYYQMTGQVNIEALKKRAAENKLESSAHSSRNSAAFR